MVDQTAKLLGKALATVSCVVNPAAFVIGGGMAKAGDILLDAIEEILPWYSEVQPKKSAEIINYMKQQINNGNQIFYNIYSEEEKLELSKKGYNAFALIYRPGAQTACEDLARSIAFLHEHQKEWNRCQNSGMVSTWTWR